MIIASFPKGSFPEYSWPVGTWPAAFIDTTNIQYTEVMEFAVCIATSAGFDVVLPNDIETVTGTGAVTVSGAGSTEYNGTYIETGTRGGKPRYQMPYDSPRGYLFIVWNDYNSAWSISVAGLDSDLGLQVYVGARYFSNEDVATPDLVTVWSARMGALPVPTVTSTNSGISVTVPVTVEMPMLVEIETYEELSA